MVIVDEKQMLPPPPYSAAGSDSERLVLSLLTPVSGTSFSIQRPAATFEALPSHLVLHIVNCTLIPRKGKADVEYTRKVFYWMTFCLRLVNRSLYIACMHVLRSTYLPAYLSMVKPPYTSDPFPLLSPSSGSADASASNFSMMSPVNTIQRETQVLDMFLAAKVREDVWADDTELHLEREEAFQDLFSVSQPRARLEDLVREYGTATGIISASATAGAGSASSASSSCHPASSPSMASPSSPSTRQPVTVTPPPPSLSRLRAGRRVRHQIPFSSLTCSIGPRNVGLVLTTKTGRRTIVEVPRAKGERLESAAKRLIKGLEGWVVENYTT